MYLQLYNIKYSTLVSALPVGRIERVLNSDSITSYWPVVRDLGQLPADLIDISRSKVFPINEETRLRIGRIPKCNFVSYHITTNHARTELHFIVLFVLQMFNQIG